MPENTGERKPRINPITAEEIKLIIQEAEGYSLHTQGLLHKIRVEGMPLSEAYAKAIEDSEHSAPYDSTSEMYKASYTKARDYLTENAIRYKIADKLTRPQPPPPSAK